MDFIDIIVTPLILILVYFTAYWLRPILSNAQTRRFFIPAITVKIIGAILIGFIYNFYYTRGGDTTEYHVQAKQIYNAFYSDPITGIQLLLSSGEDYQGITSSNSKTFDYISKMRFYGGKSEYFVTRVTGFLGLFTLHSYTSIAVLYAFFSFFGIWMAYRTFLKLYPRMHLEFAISFLFLPSVVLWGSGIMKDSIVLGAVGFAIYSFYRIFFEGRPRFFTILILIVSLYTIFIIKIYVLFALLPAMLLWYFLSVKNKIPNALIRRVSAPTFILISIALGYYAILNISAGDRRYDITEVGERTKINAEYLYYVSNKNQGSGYYLGELDGSIGSMVRLVPAALNVTLFRPYIWEVRNPLMLFSALESTMILLFSLSLFYKPGLFRSFRQITGDHTLIFCLLFTFILAVAVGLNSYNFGTLSRYKIPLLPFFVSALFVLKNYRKRALN